MRYEASNYRSCFRSQHSAAYCCLGWASSSTDSTATVAPATTPRDGGQELRVTSAGTIPTEAPLAPTVEVLQPSVTADRTARITVEVTNTADYPVWHTSVRIPGFSNFITHPDSDGRKLLLLEPEEQYATVRSGCWRADLSKPQINNAYTDVVGNTRYDPGETTTTEFDIYGHPDNTGSCLLPGEYPIDAMYAVRDDSNTDTTEWEYRWGFSLAIDES